MWVKLNIHKVTVIALVLFALSGLLVVALDWGDVRRIIGQADWAELLPSVLLAAVSYACVSYSLALVFRTFGVGLTTRDAMEIGFVSGAMDNLLNTGGVTGLSVQFLLVKRRGVATESILAPSLFQIYVSSLMLFALLPLGLINVLATRHLSQGDTFGLSIVSAILIAFLAGASLLVFAGSLRSAVFRGLAQAAHFITHRRIDTELNDFDSALSRGVALMRQRPKMLGILLLLSMGDWASTVAALWFCFSALGNPVGIGTLLTGFTLGIAAGFVSLVPGGLGVQEASMAGIFALLGVPIGLAILAAILFRIVYYFIPFLVSLSFYRRLLR